MTTTLTAPAPAGTGQRPGALAPRGGRRRRILLRLLSPAVFYALWEITARVMRNPTFIPSPGAVWHQLILTSTTHDGVRGYSGHLLVEHLGVSLRRILIGSVVGVAAGLVAGLVAGVVMGTVGWIRVVAEPVVTFVRALPPLAYFSLFIIWFGIDETPKLWLLAIAAMPPVAVATASAVHSAPSGLVEAARALGAGRGQVIRDVVLPNALPEIITGIRLAVGIAYSSVVAAETINGIPGIGGMVRDAQRYSQTDVVVLGLFATASDDEIVSLRAALVDRKVLFLRDQKLDDDAQVDLGRRIGELTASHPVVGGVDAAHPEVYALDSTDNGFADVWHTDVTFMKRPPLGSILRPVVLPPSGGDTNWADAQLAYDSLAAPVRRLADQLTAVHDGTREFGYYLAQRRGGQGNEWDGEVVTRLDPVEHPVVRVHPETGRRASSSTPVSPRTSSACPSSRAGPSSTCSTPT